MQITRTRSKYYVLSILGALMLCLGVLIVAPSAQAQVAPEPPSIDKECTPNPVQVGGEIICTIDVVAAPGTVAQAIVVTDTFPAGLTVTGATGQLFIEGQPIVPAPCEVANNTVTCEIPVLVSGEANLTFEATIEARADQCGTLQNTATATGDVREISMQALFPFSVADTEQITVEGCEVPPAPEPDQQQPDQQQPDQQQGSPAPITQDFEQESEAGEIDQAFDIS